MGAVEDGVRETKKERAGSGGGGGRELGGNFATMNISQSKEGLKIHCGCPNPNVYLNALY